MGMMQPPKYKVKRKNPETGQMEWVTIIPPPVEFKHNSFSRDKYGMATAPMRQFVFKNNSMRG